MPAKEVMALKRIPRLFCLVDAGHDVSLLPELVEAGVDGIQIRAKSLNDAELIAFARSVIAAVPATTVLVNDRTDIALAAGADGVHLGSEDLPIVDARRIAPGLILGATVRSRAQAEQAAADGADYAGFGPIFATGSKDGLPDPLGLDAITTAAGVLPLVAIGGIDANSAAAARTAGAHGIAVIGGIWNAADPIAAAKALAP